MFQHILIPLDGSHLAEAVLPAAAYLAQTFGSQVTLFHVIERAAPSQIHGATHLTTNSEACAYLDQVADRAFPTGSRVERHVHTGAVNDVAPSIVEHAAEFEAELIVMCTHGRGGLRSWLVGSIAQQVISLGTTPVLLIQPTPTGSAPAFLCHRLLVPLDGDPDHEQGLAVAATLAQRCASTLHLLTAVHTLSTLPGRRAATARFLPGTTSALLDLKAEQAATYLQQQVTRLDATGLTVTAAVVRGDPAQAIVHTAHQLDVDVIVLGTHGKKGPEAFWTGSVAPKVAGQTQVPVLLVPVAEPTSEP